MFTLFGLLLVGMTAPAHAADKAALVRTHGYVSPRFQAVFRPDARPIDQERIGMSQTKAGLIFSGTVVPTWTFKVHFVVGADPINALISADPVDENNDGETDGIDGT